MKFVLAALLLASTALALPVQQVDDTRSLSERHQTELAHVITNDQSPNRFCA